MTGVTSDERRALAMPNFLAEPADAVLSTVEAAVQVLGQCIAGRDAGVWGLDVICNVFCRARRPGRDP